MTTIVTAQQRTNVLKALELWAQVPPEQVVEGLSTWYCGTQACFGGHLMSWPFFQAQGVVCHPADGMPSMTFLEWPGDVSQALFGDETLFNARGFCPADDSFADGTDHELVTHRLQQLIECSEVVA